jgi:hypothetical protein
MSKGMDGFTGSGELELGTVRGYRLWRLERADAKFYLRPKTIDPWPLIKPIDPSQYLQPALYNIETIEIRSLVGTRGFVWPEHGVSTPVKAQCDEIKVFERTKKSSTLSEKDWEQYYEDNWKNKLHSPDEIPAKSCGCGFWAYWDSGLNVAQLCGRKPGTPFVIGVVEGQGDTLIGPLGFRTAEAKLLGLAVIPEQFTYVTSDGYPGRLGCSCAICMSTFKPDCYEVVRPWSAQEQEDIRWELTISYPGAFVAKDVIELIGHFGYDKTYWHPGAHPVQRNDNAWMPSEGEAWRLPTLL